MQVDNSFLDFGTLGYVFGGFTPLPTAHEYVHDAKYPFICRYEAPQVKAVKVTNCSKVKSTVLELRFVPLSLERQ